MIKGQGTSALPTQATGTVSDQIHLELIKGGRMLETEKERMHKCPHTIFIHVHRMAVGTQSCPNMELEA